MQVLLTLTLVLLPLPVLAEPLPTIGADRGSLVAYNGASHPSPRKDNAPKDLRERQKSLEQNVGKKFWTTKSNSSFYELPGCRKRIALDHGQWFTITRLMIDTSKSDPSFRLSHPRYEVTLENGSPACFAQLLSGTIDNDINIFKEDKSQRIVEELAGKGIGPGKTLWTKYPFQGHPAFTRVHVTNVTVEADTAASETITVRAEIDGTGQETITANSTGAVSDRFYPSDPVHVTAQWDRKTLEAIGRMKLHVGMTKVQAIASWGPPEKIDRSFGPWGVTEAWRYGAQRHLTVTNGIVTEWQE